MTEDEQPDVLALEDTEPVDLSDSEDVADDLPMQEHDCEPDPAGVELEA